VGARGDAGEVRSGAPSWRATVAGRTGATTDNTLQGVVVKVGSTCRVSREKSLLSLGKAVAVLSVSERTDGVDLFHIELQLDDHEVFLYRTGRADLARLTTTHGPKLDD